MRMAQKWVAALVGAALLWAGAAQAADFSFGLFGEDVETVLNNTFTAGASCSPH